MEVFGDETIGFSPMEFTIDPFESDSQNSADDVSVHDYESDEYFSAIDSDVSVSAPEFEPIDSDSP